MLKIRKLHQVDLPKIPVCSRTGFRVKGFKLHSWVGFLVYIMFLLNARPTNLNNETEIVSIY